MEQKHPASRTIEPHSSTSASPRSQYSDHSRGGLVGMVLAAHGGNHLSDPAADEMEWLLDSGPQVNLRGDLTCFSLIEHGVSSELKMALGQTESVEASDSVAMRVKNVLTGRWEPRRLDEVRYSPNAHVNLMSLGYMPSCGFTVSFSTDQRIAWLTKGSMKLRFDQVDKLYRLRVKRSIRQVAAVEARKNAMGLLHNRLGHVNVKLIHEMVKGKVDFGVYINLKELSDCDCFPCLTAKFKRTSYKRHPERRQHLLENMSVDLCSINQ